MQVISEEALSLRVINAGNGNYALSMWSAGTAIPTG